MHGRVWALSRSKRRQSATRDWPVERGVRAQRANHTATFNSQPQWISRLLGPLSRDEIQFSRLISLAPYGNAGHLYRRRRWVKSNRQLCNWRLHQFPAGAARRLAREPSPWPLSRWEEGPSLAVSRVGRWSQSPHPGPLPVGEGARE